MVKALVFVLSFAVATGVFALMHGCDEYETARSAYTYRIVDGMEVERRPDELISDYLIGVAMGALPVGAVAVVLLSLTMHFIGRALHDFPPPFAYFLGLLAGMAAGGLLSLLAWLTFGGWGPPFLRPAIVSGLVVGPACLAFWRNRLKTSYPW